MMTSELVLPETMVGMIEASAMRNGGQFIAAEPDLAGARIVERLIGVAGAA